MIIEITMACYYHPDNPMAFCYKINGKTVSFEKFCKQSAKIAMDDRWEVISGIDFKTKTGNECRQFTYRKEEK